MLIMVIPPVTIPGIATVAICTDIEWHRQSLVVLPAETIDHQQHPADHRGWTECQTRSNTPGKSP